MLFAYFTVYGTRARVCVPIDRLRFSLHHRHRHPLASTTRSPFSLPLRFYLRHRMLRNSALSIVGGVFGFFGAHSEKCYNREWTHKTVAVALADSTATEVSAGKPTNICLRLVAFGIFRSTHSSPQHCGGASAFLIRKRSHNYSISCVLYLNFWSDIIFGRIHSRTSFPLSFSCSFFCLIFRTKTIRRILSIYRFCRYFLFWHLSEQHNFSVIVFSIDKCKCIA